LVKWLESGAAWTSAKAAAQPALWSLRKPTKPTPPEGRGSPIDAFIVAKLKEKGLEPAREADRRTLIRRLTFDLHGLAPTFAGLEEVSKNDPADASERIIDRLLASPRYGEKWGKHWLDLVRYGDTSGFEQDPYLLYAWRYRDYVIQSFNDDKPYDR